MELKFKMLESSVSYEVQVGRDTGNNVRAVRVIDTRALPHTVRYTEKFDDSRHGDRAISEAIDFMQHPY